MCCEIVGRGLCITYLLVFITFFSPRELPSHRGIPRLRNCRNANANRASANARNEKKPGSHVRRKCKRKVNTSPLFAILEKDFDCACVSYLPCVCVRCENVSCLHLRLHLSRTCEPGLNVVQQSKESKEKGKPGQ